MGLLARTASPSVLICAMMQPFSLALLQAAAAPRLGVRAAQRRRAQCAAVASTPPELESPQGVPASIYSRPQLYDAAFGTGRDFDSEIAFLVEAAASLGGAPPLSFLELACGPGRHARAAAAAGLTACGLDAAAEMVAYATEQAVLQFGAGDSASPSPRFVLGDMAAPATAPGLPRGRFDIVACLHGSLGHMLTLEQAAACFDAAAALLSPAGVFVVEVDHPRRLFDGSVAYAARADASGEMLAPTWDVESLRVQWGAPGDAFDPLRQVLSRTVCVRSLAGLAAGAPPLLHDVVNVRLFTAAELALLASQVGLDVAAVYGGLDDEAEAEDEEAERLVLVFTHGRD